jgi:hypothetical protein
MQPALKKLRVDKKNNKKDKRAWTRPDGFEEKRMTRLGELRELIDDIMTKGEQRSDLLAMYIPATYLVQCVIAPLTIEKQKEVKTIAYRCIHNNAYYKSHGFTDITLHRPNEYLRGTSHNLVHMPLGIVLDLIHQSSDNSMAMIGQLPHIDTRELFVYVNDWIENGTIPPITESVCVWAERNSFIYTKAAESKINKTLTVIPDPLSNRPTISEEKKERAFDLRLTDVYHASSDILRIMKAINAEFESSSSSSSSSSTSSLVYNIIYDWSFESLLVIKTRIVIFRIGTLGQYIVLATQVGEDTQYFKDIIHGRGHTASCRTILDASDERFHRREIMFRIASAYEPPPELLYVLV